jgi:hypothetical protein
MAGITPSRGTPLVRINSGPLAAIAAGAALNTHLKLTGQANFVKNEVPPRLADTLHGTIEDVVLYVVNNVAIAPAAIVSWWGNDSNNVTALATVKCWGKEVLSASEFVRQASGLTTSIWIAHVGGLSIPYKDLDNSGEFHLTVENEYGSTAFNASKSRVEFGFRPEYPA